jgi:hypothetical protein
MYMYCPGSSLVAVSILHRFAVFLRECGGESVCLREVAELHILLNGRKRQSSQYHSYFGEMKLRTLLSKQARNVLRRVTGHMDSARGRDQSLAGNQMGL